MTSYQTKEQEGGESFYSIAGASMSRIVNYEKDSRIFSIGEDRDSAFIIDGGLVYILDHKGDRLCELGPGEIFGEMALLAGGQRTATAVAAKDTSVFMIPRKTVEARMHGLDPMVSLLIGLLIERYRATRIQIPESIREEGAQDLFDRLEKSGSAAERKTYLNTQKQKEMALKELAMEQELRGALIRKEFVPFLQPIVTLPEQEIIGFEALIRWNHPDRGIVGPFEFVPVAERTGVVQLLDAMMVEKACEIVSDLVRVAGREVYIAVNLSGINFENLDLVGTIDKIMRHYGTNPQHIRMEITESALIDEPESAEEVLRGLKDLGLTIALDDFGTGYSSLSYLHKFSIDTIKIDRAFIDKIDLNPKSMDIVRAIIGLAQTFKLETVAEGIERKEEALALASLGCSRGQGYYFSKPVCVDDAKALLAV